MKRRVEREFARLMCECVVPEDTPTSQNDQRSLRCLPVKRKETTPFSWESKEMRAVLKLVPARRNRRPCLVSKTDQKKKRASLSLETWHLECLVWDLGVLTGLRRSRPGGYPLVNEWDRFGSCLQ